LLNLVNRDKKASDIHEEKWNGLGGKFEAGKTPKECVSHLSNGRVGDVHPEPEIFMIVQPSLPVVDSVTIKGGPGFIDVYL